MVPEAWQQLRGNEEILPRLRAACHVDHLVVDSALRAWVHALVDLVDE